jgi:hypothetical protein
MASGCSGLRSTDGGLVSRSLQVGSLAMLVLVLGVLLATRTPTVSAVDQALSTVSASVMVPKGATVAQARMNGDHLALVVVDITGDRLRITVTEDLDSTAAQRRTDDVLAVIHNLFGDRQAPYPGQLSHTLQCPARFQPQDLPHDGETLARLSLYANDRLAYGGCSEDLLRYHATVSMVYDADAQRLFQVEAFAALGAGLADAGAAARGAALVDGFALHSGGS